MTAEILAATEHLVPRRVTNDDAAALASWLVVAALVARQVSLVTLP